MVKPILLLLNILLSKCIANAESKYKILVCTACTRSQRAHGALEYPTALQQRPHSALCKRQAAAFVLSMFEINVTA